MKSKIDVTIFKNGDIDMLHASIYEELWKDYCALKKRARMHEEKNTAKGAYLCRRYQRAALLSLFAFFEGVLDNWLHRLQQDYQEYQHVSMANLKEKCDAVLGYCFFCTYTKRTQDFTELYEIIGRFEQHDVSLIEHINRDMLMKTETAMDVYLCYVEAMTTLQRFPKPDKSTTGLMDKLGGMVKGCRS